MSRMQKIENVFMGICMLLGGMIIVLLPEDGYLICLLIFSVSMMLKGLSQLVFFFTMARHMVGGRMILYWGIIWFDLGMFAATIMDVKKAYVMIYMIIGMLFAGVIDVMRAMEAKKISAPRWKISLAIGLVNIILPLGCLFFAKSAQYLTDVYVFGMMYSGIMRIVSAFRKTAVLTVPE